MNVNRPVLLTSVSALLCGACAAPTAQPTLELDPRAVAAFDGHTGERLEWSTIVARASNAEAVLIGENHGHPLGLASAAALFEDLVAAQPRATLAMEFFERDEQSRLDDWLAGLSDDATFEARTQRSAGNYPPGHRAMLQTAKAEDRAVYAANAPRPYVRLARSQGYEALAQLTPEQQRLYLLPPRMVDGRYRESFDAFMAGGADPKSDKVKPRLDSVFRSQSLWDWTMADCVVDAVRGAQTPLVLVVGRFHVDHEGGTVQAIEHLRPGTRTFVVSYVNQASDKLQDDDKQRGDVVLYCGPQPE